MRCGAVRCMAIVIHFMCLASTGVCGDEWVIHIGHIIVEIESYLVFDQNYYYKPIIP